MPPPAAPSVTGHYSVMPFSTFYSLYFYLLARKARALDDGEQ